MPYLQYFPGALKTFVKEDYAVIQQIDYERAPYSQMKVLTLSSLKEMSHELINFSTSMSSKSETEKKIIDQSTNCTTSVDETSVVEEVREMQDYNILKNTPTTTAAINGKTSTSVLEPDDKIKHHNSLENVN